MTDTNNSKSLRRLCNNCDKVLEQHDGSRLTVCAAELYLKQSMPYKYEKVDIVSNTGTTLVNTK